MKSIYKISDNYIKTILEFDDLKIQYENVHQRDENVRQSDESINVIIRKLILKNPQIMIQEMAEAVGKSYKTIWRHISLDKSIKYIGSSKKGYWEISE